MNTLKEFFSVLDEYAPIRLSHLMIEKGDYDNSGIIVEVNDTVERVLFSLDLSQESVLYAVKNGCDTIVTHHPAIYQPIKSLSYKDTTCPLLMAIANRKNVISMHLNLDVAERGVDYYLMQSTLASGKFRTLDYVDGECGYGRDCDTDFSLETLVNNLKNSLGTDKIIVYGQGMAGTIATFCGGGSSHALNYILSGKSNADTVITSDMPHHVIKELIEKGKNIVLIPHYASEEYGFNKFYEFVKEKLKNQITAYYFDDKRFK